MSRWNRRTAALAIVMLFAVPYSGQAALPDSGSLSVSLRAQETNMWCWAASGEMVMEFLGQSVSQCDEANRRFGYSNCCSKPTPGDCVRGGWPEFGKYGFTFQQTNRAGLSWDALRTEISVRGRPFAFSWAWRGGGGHMMVVRGFFTANGTRFVSINDPWPPNAGDQRDITYEEYLEGSDHTHWDDYYAVARPGVSGVSLAEAKPAPKPEAKKMQPQRGVGLAAAVEQTREVARRSLDTYRKMTTWQKGPGIAGAGVTLGDPFPVVFIGLSSLRAVGMAEPKWTEPPEATKVLYPIQAPGGIHSAVTLERKGEQWETVSYGNAALAKLLDQARRRYAAEHQRPIADFHAVSIPALNTYFVATRSANDLTYIPVIDDPSLGIKANVPVNAAEVMPRLREAARKHDGLPR